MGTSGVPLSDWSGSGATDRLHETIIQFNEAATKADGATARAHAATCDPDVAPLCRARRADPPTPVPLDPPTTREFEQGPEEKRGLRLSWPRSCSVLSLRRRFCFGRQLSVRQLGGVRVETCRARLPPLPARLAYRLAHRRLRMTRRGRLRDEPPGDCGPVDPPFALRQLAHVLVRHPSGGPRDRRSRLCAVEA